MEVGRGCSQLAVAESEALRRARGCVRRAFLSGRVQRPLPSHPHALAWMFLRTCMTLELILASS